MAIDIVGLCVLGLLCGGATEIPRALTPRALSSCFMCSCFTFPPTGTFPDLFGTRLGRGLDGVFYHLPAPPSPQPQPPQPLPQNPVPGTFFLSRTHPAASTDSPASNASTC